MWLKAIKWFSNFVTLRTLPPSESPKKNIVVVRLRLLLLLYQSAPTSYPIRVPLFGLQAFLFSHLQPWLHGLLTDMLLFPLPHDSR